MMSKSYLIFMRASSAKPFGPRQYRIIFMQKPGGITAGLSFFLFRDRSVEHDNRVAAFDSRHRRFKHANHMIEVFKL